jgi:flavin-dependent dehydrogenase
MMAILLAKLGYRVSVYEKREDPRVVCLIMNLPPINSFF